MRVTAARTRLVQLPANTLLDEGSSDLGSSRQFVTLELETDDGIVGIGLTMFGGSLSASLREAVDALSQLAIGENPLHVEAIVHKLRQAASSAGPGGILTLALSAIDLALWDIKGKMLNQSICTLIGGFRDRVPTYASGALPRTLSVDSIPSVGQRLVEMGFMQIKMQLGAQPMITREVERVRVLRESVGESVALLGDVNQLWTAKRAIEVGRRLEPYRPFWLEDVVSHDDYAGQARVAAALTIPITAGEYHYGVVPFRHLLEARSTDIVMIDLVRVGGVTQWLKVAAMAEAFHIPVVSHLLPEMAVHLIAGVPNGLTVEYMPWTLRLFEETPAIVDGQIVVPEKPGWGLMFAK